MGTNTFASMGGANSTTPNNKRKLPNLPYLNTKDPLQVAPLTNTALNTLGITPTGDGGDGQVQTSNPTSMVQTKTGPLMIHEGEGTVENKDGSVTVVPQKQLADMQKNLNIPGMETGGTYEPAATTATTTAAADTTTPAATTTATTATDSSGNAVLNAAQNQVLTTQDSQNPLSDLITSKTTDLLNSTPTTETNAAYKQNQLENYDYNTAAEYEALRQKNADVSNTGLYQKDSLANQLQALRDRTTLETTIDSDQAAATEKTALDNLASARETNSANQDSTNSAIDNLVKVYGMEDTDKTIAADAATTDKTIAATSYENALDRAQELTVQSNDIQGNKDLTSLKAKLDGDQQISSEEWQAAQNALDRLQETAIQTGDIEGQKEIEQLKSDLSIKQMVAEEDFTGAQAELDRLHDIAMQEGDTEGQLKIEKLKGEIEAKAQEVQNEYDNGQRIASEAWQTGERVSEEDYNTATKYLDAEIAKAQSDSDFEHESYLQDKKGKLDLQMQTNDMDQETKMAYLNAQLEEAKANNDVDRQEQIITFQTTQDIAKITAQGGIDAGLAEIKNRYDLALQNNDIVSAEAMKKLELSTQVSEAAKDRILQQAQLDLEAKKVDMDAIEAEYSKIMDQIDAGTLDADAGYNYVMEQLAAAGVDTTSDAYNLVDSEAAAQEKIQAEYDQEKQQFQLTHPEAYNKTWNVNGKQVTLEEYNENGKYDFTEESMSVFGEPTVQLSTQGMQDFNDYLNKTLYGEMTQEEKDEKAVAGYLGIDDIGVAAPGDKYNLTEAANVNGNIIPAGKYSVETESDDSGSKFFGTKQTLTTTYLVNSETGERYVTKSSESGTSGNIISNLWA
jgi:hypothetical protein